MRLILSAILIAAVMPAAFSQGDYLLPDYLYTDHLKPDASQMYLRDWLEGGYVRSLDRSRLMDPGIAGMVRWLDAPVPSTLGTARMSLFTRGWLRHPLLPPSASTMPSLR
ncbi:MAG: hypothetical protein ACP5PV_02900 [Methanothrix sp.]